ncbi:MAG: FHA domain-containing protein, partial [Cyanobacteria bacterium J06649_4]
MLKTKIINTHTNSVYEAQLKPKSPQQSECLIGRHPNCDLVLDGPAVSRVHGRVLFASGQCFFTDLGSSDGSRLNNEETAVNHRYAIAPDDILRIGEFALIIEDLLPAETAESSESTQASIWSANQPNGELIARCIQINDETSDVKTFRFVAEPARRFDFKPGQFVTFKLPITHPAGHALAGRPVTRSYSISSSPSRPHTLDITVKRVGAASAEHPPGIASNWLHDEFTVGMTLPLLGPFGDFNCVDHPADKLLLISAGSGITPMMSMSQWLSDCASETDITFIHVARSVPDIIFRQRLELLAAQHSHFQLAFSLSRPSGSIPWSGYRGRLNPALLSAICPDFDTRTAFVCGPAGFMDSTKQLLQSTGFPMENYFEESFGGPPAKKSASQKSASQKSISQDPSTNQTAKSASPPIPAAEIATVTERIVEFASAGKQVSCDEEDTLLDAAEQAGVTMASGCR